MAPASSLQTLLADLARAKSPLDKLRQLALGWRSLRELDPKERADLATRLGLDGAEDLVERLANRKGGLGPSELLEAVHAARQSEPAKLRQLMAGLRNKETRQAVVMGGVEALRRELLEEPNLAANEEPLFELLPEEAEPPVPPPPAEEEAAVQEPDEAETDSETEPETAPEPEPKPETEPELEPELEPGPLREARTAPPAVVAPAPSRHTVEEVMGRLAAATSLVGRLRALRDVGHELADLDVFELRRLVDTFPEGWARRRAVAGLFAAGVPHSLAVALDLVMGLEHERDRVWCLSALLSIRPRVQGGLLDSALESVTSPLVRRRLERMAAAAS